MNTEKDILNGTIQNDEVLECLKNGGQIASTAAYLCSECKEFVTDGTIYFHTDITVSPYGTVRYDAIFPFEKPKCNKCHTEMIYMDNRHSSKVKFPKCGGDLTVKLTVKRY